jgi:hypothetical protein
MSDQESEGGAEFWLGPVDHPMSRAHEAEAERCGAKFYNFGWSLGEDAISSRTDKGVLSTVWDAQAEQWHHVWTDYD